MVFFLFFFFLSILRSQDENVKTWYPPKFSFKLLSYRYLLSEVKHNFFQDGMNHTFAHKAFFQSFL